VRVTEPDESDSDLSVEVSVDCRGIERRDGGVALRTRERLVLKVGVTFPFAPARVWTTRRRWAGTPHVHWGRVLCLYQSPSTEWLPSDGMYGLVERLFLWLEAAAAGELDPEDAPLHPPVTYNEGSRLVVPRVDTPAVQDAPWLGWVKAEQAKWRTDLVGWEPHKDADNKWTLPPKPGGPAVLVPVPFSWEYPRTVRQLMAALREAGVEYWELRLLLQVGSLRIDAGDPMLVVVGTAMRGIQGQARKQHLAVWEVDAETVGQLRTSLEKYAPDEGDPESELRGEQAEEAFEQWASSASVSWCWVREDRPEVVIRRDEGSPMRWFEGKNVVVWGCGALGAPLAEWLARAGVRRLELHDKAVVTPGLLVRQPYRDEDVGAPKVWALKDRLEAIRPDLDVEVYITNLLNGPLAEEEWTNDLDLVIDTTASVAVSSKLELSRRVRTQRPPPLVALMVGHEATRWLAVLSSRGYSGATLDLLRQAKLKTSRLPQLRGFRDEFWPAEPRTEVFQPEPGCSDPTFRGSGAEVQGLCSEMLVRLARHLDAAAGTDGWVGMGSASQAPEGSRSHEFTCPPARCIPAGNGDFEVRVSASAGAELQAWIHSNARELGTDVETGGVLFGERDEAAGVIWIDEVTGPPPDSIRDRTEFVCGTQGVRRLTEEKEARGQGSLRPQGMWHTHPDGGPQFSPRDVGGMLELLDSAEVERAHSLVLIVGFAATKPALAAYVVERGFLLENNDVMTILAGDAQPMPPRPPSPRIGLALSGGGARAMAFHLGCLRALHDRDLLNRLTAISSVSGGSLISAMWAYSDETFEEFDQRVCELLRRGLQGGIARRFAFRRSPGALATSATAGMLAGGARVLSLGARLASRLTGHPVAALDPPLRRWVTVTDAFEDVLRNEVTGDRLINAERRAGLDVVINACDLRTGSAFRFGSRESGSWRCGELVGNQVPLSTAVAASAAFPLILPALDRRWSFRPRRGGDATDKRVVLTDGGVFDNLGTTCFEPGRSDDVSFNVIPVDYIIACDAGRGLLDPSLPWGWASRVRRSFDSTYRKAQDRARGRLFDAVESGELDGLVMAYLGQQDGVVPNAPADLVRREQVADYPTNFAPINPEALESLTRRGEQLTRLLVAHWCPEL
jgi:predicted acylesterase/phospholipase RssA